MIEWKRVNCCITDMKDGREIFRQDDVEVPAQWSQTAADMLAQKYFRKAGVPSDTGHIERDREFGLSQVGLMPDWLLPSVPSTGATTGGETSARQVFHRLAGAWAYHGWKSGLLTEEVQAQIFYDECYLALALQYAAPNSPQWFNSGLWWAYGITGPASGQWASV